MKQNMGNIDKALRTLAAVVIAVLYFTDQISGIAAVILGLFAVIFLLTSAMGFCPLYLPFKLSTKKSDTEGK
jgi:Na+(H+)/acetate symporter ActP